MFDMWMTSGRFGAGVADPWRIEGTDLAVARLRHGQVEFLGAVAIQRYGAPTA